MDTFIRDIGHLVYHYTKFENAIKIISSRSLIFGEFGNMNDIAESRREIFGNIPINKINIELSKYKGPRGIVRGGRMPLPNQRR